MSTSTIKRVLHAEDDPMQQRLLAHHLLSMEEFRFEIRAVQRWQPFARTHSISSSSTINLPEGMACTC
jgi:hypothetical protein